MGGAKFAPCPGRHLTSLRPCCQCNDAQFWKQLKTSQFNSRWSYSLSFSFYQPSVFSPSLHNQSVSTSRTVSFLEMHALFPVGKSWITQENFRRLSQLVIIVDAVFSITLGCSCLQENNSKWTVRNICCWLKLLMTRGEVISKSMCPVHALCI